MTRKEIERNLSFDEGEVINKTYADFVARDIHSSYNSRMAIHTLLS